MIFRKRLRELPDARASVALAPSRMDDTTYPVALEIDYPDRPLNRLTTTFRPFVAIPILVVLATVSGGSSDWSHGDTRTTVARAGALLDDRYPSTEDEQAVHLTMPRPDVAAATSTAASRS